MRRVGLEDDRQRRRALQAGRVPGGWGGRRGRAARAPRVQSRADRAAGERGAGESAGRFQRCDPQGTRGGGHAGDEDRRGRAHRRQRAGGSRTRPRVRRGGGRARSESR